MARINRNKVMETARRAKDKGQFDKAIREYQKLIAEDPNDVRVLLKIGDLYAQKGAKTEATDTYTRVARLYNEQGFYLKSVAVYKQILKLDPRLVEINLRLAELYRQLGLLSDAMQHFDMVAAFFHREGQTREALATLRQLVELDPDNVATRIKLAELYSKEEMTDEAIAEFSSACDFLRSHNRIDDFIKVAERLLWHKQDNIALNKELATLYLHRNDPRRALQKLQVCFKADGRDVDTLSLLAQAFQALEQRGKTVSVLKELARVLTDTGERREAEEVHRRILSFVPEDPDSLAFLGISAAVPAQEEISEVEVADDMIVEEPAAAVGEFARSPMGNPTGSFPLIRQQSEAEPAHDNANFAAPAFGGDASFSAIEGQQQQHAHFDLVDEPSYQSSVRGEANSDEIVKVLTETDVYVKYGLHQKAIEHLHRVFELDPDNLEARERLKDIFLSLGREREAISQLIHLASVVAPREPDRAQTYLRSIFDYDPNHAEAHAIASRYRIDLSEEAIADDSGLDFGRHDQIAFTHDPVPVDPVEPAIGYASGSPLPQQFQDAPSDPGFEVAQEFDSYDPSYNFDDPASAGFESVPTNAAGSPAASTSVGDYGAATDYPAVTDYASTDYSATDYPATDYASTDYASADYPATDYAAADYVDYGASPEYAPPAFESPGELPAPPDYAQRPGSQAPMTLEPEPPLTLPAEDQERSFDFELDLGSSDEIDVLEEPPFEEPPTTVGTDEGATGDSGIYTLSDDDIILDEGPDEGVTMEVSLDAVEAHIAEAEERAASIDLDDLEFDSVPLDVSAAPAEGYEASELTPAEQLRHFQPPIAGDAAEPYYADDLEAPSTAEMDGEFAPPDEYAESRTISDDRHGGAETDASPLLGQPDDVTVDVPLEAIDAAIAAKRAQPRDTTADPQTGRPEPRETAPPALEDDLDEADFFMSQGLFDEAREILNAAAGRHPNHLLIESKLAEIEASENGDAAIDELTHDPTIAAKPSVLLEKPVDDEDADTHFDLGLAYKEMGLHEEAIKAFTKVIHVAGRAVQCYLMLGLCHREQGDLTEAITQFKAGLYVDQISTAEKYGLYYEIGSSYEHLDDPQEALYYYEMIVKKQPDYRDVSERVAVLRERHPAKTGTL